MKLKNLAKILACFSLMISGVQSNTQAAIITVPLNYTTDAEDDQNLTLSGEITINTALDTGNQRLTSFSLRDNKQTIPNWITAISFTLTDNAPTTKVGSQELLDYSGTFVKSDFSHIIWDPKVANENNVDFNSDLVGQFDDLAFTGVGNLVSTAALNQDRGHDEFILPSTPLPIPFIGFLSIFSFVKKLKRYKNLSA